MKIRAVTTDKYGFKREIGATEIFEEIYGAQRVEACDKPVTESFRVRYSAYGKFVQFIAEN